MQTNLSTREQLSIHRPNHLSFDREDGVSLVEILMAVGLGGILLAIIATLLPNIQKVSAYQTRVAMFEHELIIMAKHIRKGCEVDFAGISFRTSQQFLALAGAEIKIADFQSLNLDSHGSQKLVVGLNKSRGIDITSISLIQTSPPMGSVPRIVQAAIEIQGSFQKPEGKDAVSTAPGQGTRKFRIPITAIIEDESHLAIGCAYTEEGPENICQTMKGIYNNVTKECQNIQPFMKP